MPRADKKKNTMLGPGNGDNVWFFVLNNVFSMVIFFIFGYSSELFVSITLISQILSVDFINLYMIILFWNILSSVIGWIIAYFTLKIVKRYAFKKATKNFNDLNIGLNKFPLTSLAFYISVLLSTLSFTIGALVILENMLFSELSIITIMITYLIMKLGIYGITKMIIESKF